MNFISIFSNLMELKKKKKKLSEPVHAMEPGPLHVAGSSVPGRISRKEFCSMDQGPQ